MTEAFAEWLGRQEVLGDLVDPAPLGRLSALLDHKSPPWREGLAPPLAHWLYFLPDARQSELDADGHPRRGGLLPPITLPRRMWAGSRVRFLAPMPLHAAVRRCSEVVAIRSRRGRSGEIIFVTVRHEVLCAEESLLVEEQDIVYRGPPAGLSEAPPPPAEPRPARATRDLSLDAVHLFRFSALTFNSHRIHYDRDYAKYREGYPGLVVQGPYLATLLMDHFLQSHPAAVVSGFTFRAESPLFEGQTVRLHLVDAPEGADLWATGPSGDVAIRAQVAVA